MDAPIVCPICEFDQIPFEREQCPQCDADLTCFKVLDTLAAAAAQPSDASTAPKDDTRRKYPPLAVWLSGVLVLFGLAAMGYGFYRIRMIDARVNMQQSALQRAVDALVARTDLILAKQEIFTTRVTQQTDRGRQPSAQQAMPAKQTDAGPARDAKPAEPWAANPLTEKSSNRVVIKDPPGTTDQAADRRFTFYRASDSDTLWGIAKRFYGAGYLYPVLLAANPELSIYRIGHNDRIALLKDVREARRIYRAITAVENRHLYWYYTVRAGDTLSTVKARYCNAQNCLPAALKANPKAPLHPGSRIKLELAGGSQ